jgi:hypothetical protein
VVDGTLGILISGACFAVLVGWILLGVWLDGGEG